MSFVEYLKEDNFLQNILPPMFNQSININTLNGIVSIDFSNNDKFKGTIDNENKNKKKGVYTWHNGQKYSGNFYNDFFNGNGCLEFPDNCKLYGNFSGNRNSYLISDAIYITDDKRYQGSFKNNLLHGEFVIKNNEGHPFYSFNGSYDNGFKNDTEAKAKMIEDAITRVVEYNQKEKKPKTSSILLIGRYNFDVVKIGNTPYFTYNENNGEIKSNKYPKINLTFMTAHSSKGLGFDNVIIINALDAMYGFPAQLQMDPVMHLVIRDDKSIDYAEERRLFYGAQRLQEIGTCQGICSVNF